METKLYLKLKSDVAEKVHGHIKASDPASFGRLVGECLEQVCGVEQLSPFYLNTAIDEALNRLLKSGDIEIETCDNEPGYTVCFRNA